MTTQTRHSHGTFSWADLATPDPGAAKVFYGELFALKTVDESMGPEGVYTKLQRDGRDVAALYEMPPEQRAREVPAYWLPYFTVDAVDEVAARVVPLGGKLVLAPLDAHDAGRMAVVSDPSGAHLGLWQAKRSCGAELMHAPGTLTWTELMSRDLPAAVAFLTGLFGWQAHAVDMGGGMMYTLLNLPGGAGPEMNHAGGAMQLPPEWGPIPSHWLVYFAVDDCDASAARVQRLGGKIHKAPDDIPNVGRFAMCADPQGAVFAILHSKPRG